MNVHRALFIGRVFTLALGLAGCGSAESSQPATATEDSGAGGGASSAEGGAGSTSSSASSSASSGAGGEQPGGAGSAVWSKIAGDVSDQLAEAVGVDAEGNIYVAGDFAGGMDLGGGALISAGVEDIFVAKLDPTGALVWAKQLGSASRQRLTSIAVSPSGLVTLAGYFAGTFEIGSTTLTTGAANQGAFVARLDTDGHALWARVLGKTGTTSAADVAIDTSGNAYVVGAFDACLYGLYYCGAKSAGGKDAFIAKYDADGELEWAQAYGDAGKQQAKAVAIDGAGNIVLGGDFEGGITFGSDTLTSAGGSQDIFVARLDAAGDPAWAHGYGAWKVDTLEDIAVDASGNVVFTAEHLGAVCFGGGALTSSAGSGTGAIVKLNPAGLHLWSRSLDADGGSHQLAAVATDADENVLVAGAFTGAIAFGDETFTSAGSYDIVLAKLDPEGANLWSERFGDAGLQQAYGLAVGPEGDAVLAGTAAATVDFGSGPLTSAGSWDAVIAKLAP